MEKQEKQKSKKEFTHLVERINLKYGFNASRNSALFAFACQIYRNESPEDRQVYVSNISGSRSFQKVSGTSIMSLLTLNADQGSLLEIEIEGTDDLAKAFAEKLKRGLNEEGYLYEQWKSRHA